ncbi:MAG: hypothetical protein RLZZ179_308 [Verrucomicrobiota bacterium]
MPNLNRRRAFLRTAGSASLLSLVAMEPATAQVKALLQESSPGTTPPESATKPPPSSTKPGAGSSGAGTSPTKLCIKALPETSKLAAKDLRLTEIGGTRYNLHFQAWDGPKHAPAGMVVAKLRVVSQIFKWGGRLEGYPGITADMHLGSLLGQIEGRKLVCTPETLANSPACDSGWVLADHGAENLYNTSHYYRWITSEGKVKIEREGDEFVFKRTDLSLSFFMTTLSYRIGTEPPKPPDKSHIGKPVETGTLAFGLSLRVVSAI